MRAKSTAGSSGLRVRQAGLADLPLVVRYNSLMALETERLTLDPDSLAAGVRSVLDDPARGFYLVADALRPAADEGEVVSMDDDGQPVTISEPPRSIYLPVGQLMVTYEWSDWRCGDFWWIQSVYVDPEFRRQGVFRALFRHVVEQASARVDVAGLRLYTGKDNRVAHATYESLGMNGDRYVVYELVKERTRDRWP